MVDDMFDTHKFLFTLSYDNRAKGHKIEYLDKDSNIQKVEIKELIVNTSPVSCRVITPENLKVAIGYLRVTKIFDDKDELVWDMSDKEIPDVKVIGGYN